jgi:hypothetical protein
MTSRRTRILLLLGLLLTVGIWLLRRGERPHAKTEAEVPSAMVDAPTGQVRSTGSAPSGSGAVAGPEQPVEKLPIPPCWNGLLDLDEHASLATLREALLSALSSGDPLLLEYLEERLAEVIGGDSQAALQVFGWARESGAPLSTHLLAAVKHSPAVQKPEVADKLLALGADGKQSQELRKAALEALETQRSLPAPMLSRLKSVAMDEHSDEAAWLATRTIGRVMTEEFQRGGAAGSYLKELLDIGQHSGEAAVRSLALEMPSYGNIPVEKSALATLSQVLSRDPDRSVRELAAFRMGLSRDPNQALSLLGAAFEAERDLCVRWAIFRFAVRAAGPKSLPLLDKLSMTEPRLRADYEDFRAIYARGVVDFARVWQEKPERLQCLDEEG